MPSFRPPTSLLLPCLVLLIIWARPTHAFGAGNIASTARIEGQNWRHGDIEDTLLTLLMSRASNKKFSKMDVKRVYFGNWLRDYSQAVDVGTVKSVSAEAIRILLWVLGFMSFGYGTKEFEVTRDRLGCYRPEEHIDNPKDYADNLDARQFDRRLRGPVDERRELAIDMRTGLKNYIASEDMGITTSAGMVRDLFRRCIELGRQYNRSKNKADFYESLRLLGTACHCLEDYSAHSNYTELALIELGEHNVFPHVGRNTRVNIRGARGPVYPIVTGTFGGVDFLHSVMGEFSDKATQSELQELEGTVEGSYNQGDTSVIKDLLNQLPSGLFGGKDEAGKADELQANSQAAHMQNMHISPKEPEAVTKQMQEIVKQVYPIMEWHDEIMQSITEFIEKIPILPDLIEQLQDQLSIFVFSLLAPFVLPIIKQVKTELATGSSEVIASSREKQLIVFRNDNCSDPTHSMLSKDHFSNVLNEPAGKVASQILKWVVPQIVDCWDNERVDAERTIHRVVNGVFHHPALRDLGDDGARDGRHLMFGVVEKWWREMDDRERNDLRAKLSREGVEQGRNHKEGVHDTGHGCGKPLGMANNIGGGAVGGGALGGIMGALGGGQPSGGFGGQQKQSFDPVSSFASEVVGGGVLGGLVGGLVGGAGADLLGDAFGGQNAETKLYKGEQYGRDGSHTTTYTEVGHQPAAYGGQAQYGQAQYSQTQYPGGGRREEYSRYEQDGRSGQTGYGYQQQVETTGYSGAGGYQRTEERRYERPGGQWQSEEHREGFTRQGEYYSEERKHHGSSYGQEDSDEEKRLKKERKAREKEERKHHKKHHGHEDEEESGSGSEKEDRRHFGGYQQPPDVYGGGRTAYGESREEYGGGAEYGQPQTRGGGYNGGYPREGQAYGGGGGASYGGGAAYGQQGYGGGGGYVSREVEEEIAQEEAEEEVEEEAEEYEERNRW
ncbi:Het-C-domain-containing protein [Lepidopterella palustris CBS 459.81]|uniref:Het-C-domain-containing protein n=1 Tax=Lepidopterella palustris CBS 459.81 TaxID=1314670 RepID=A0A8E2EKL5_9PEZI|nr:Het-C-domain-containing protein [Lepidopterella palustris CBS 459.81]